MSEIYFFFSSI